MTKVSFFETNGRRHRIQDGVFVGIPKRIWIDVDAERRTRAEHDGADGEDAGPAANVENRSIPQIEGLKRHERQPRRRVMTGPEAHRWLNHDDAFCPLASALACFG